MSKVERGFRARNLSPILQSKVSHHLSKACFLFLHHLAYHTKGSKTLVERAVVFLFCNHTTMIGMEHNNPLST